MEQDINININDTVYILDNSKDDKVIKCKVIGKKPEINNYCYSVETENGEQYYRRLQIYKTEKEAYEGLKETIEECVRWYTDDIERYKRYISDAQIEIAEAEKQLSEVNKWLSNSDKQQDKVNQTNTDKIKYDDDK